MPDFQPSFFSLKLQELSLAVHLGCTADERARTQEVRLSLEIRFSEPPNGVVTDALSDTICYAELSERIQKRCESREYLLIERMAHDVYGVVREMLDAKSACLVTIHKVRPPVERLHGGAIFTYGDFSQ